LNFLWEAKEGKKEQAVQRFQEVNERNTTMTKKSYLSINKAFWEKMVKEDCGFTKPWLDLDIKILRNIAKGKIKNIPWPVKDMYPVSVLKDVKDKDVLCIASGGGQQSAVFGLLGAKVTVVDIAEGQLEGDRKAAAHYGYKIRIIRGDINDLSMLKAGSFDLVYQAPSMPYLRDVRKVYRQVYRVLRKGGLYRADAQNPQSQFIYEFSWDGKGYSITVPYAVKEMQRAKDEKVIEYRHYLDETFNGLIEPGFIIECVEEMPKGIYQNKDDKPGSWGHSLKYIPGFFTILARKK
jgi:ubiquinone/menaquinone biosynthesis C-methylase UbiE